MTATRIWSAMDVSSSTAVLETASADLNLGLCFWLLTEDPHGYSIGVFLSRRDLEHLGRAIERELDSTRQEAET